MQNRCKVGDLAVVVRAQNPGNIGLIVRVQGPYRAIEETHFAEGGMVWECACAHPMTWVRGGQVVHALSGPIPDSLLQPLRGLGGDRAATGAVSKEHQNEFDGV